MLGLTAGLAAGKMALGGIQTLMARKALKKEDTKFKIPEEELRAMGIADSDAQRSKITGYGTKVDRVNDNFATTTDTLSQVGGRNALDSIITAAANKDRAISDLDLAGLEQQENAKAVQRNELHALAQWKNRKNEHDIYEPEARDREAAQNQLDAGITNMFGAATDFGQGVLDNKAIDVLGGTSRVEDRNNRRMGRLDRKKKRLEIDQLNRFDKLIGQ